MIDVGMAMAAMIVTPVPEEHEDDQRRGIEPTIRCSSTLRIDALMNSDMSRTMRML
jgi:hypothetical protein